MLGKHKTYFLFEGRVVKRDILEFQTLKDLQICIYWKVVYAIVVGQKSSIGDSVTVNKIVTLLLDFRRVLLIVPRTSISSNNQENENQDTSLVSVLEWSIGGTISLPLIEYWINGNFLFGSNLETCPEVGL